MRHLCVMAFGRLRSDWDRTSAILATLINVNRSENSRPAEPRDFNPFRQDEEPIANPLHDEDWHFERRISVLPIEERNRIREKLRSGKGD